MVEQEPAILVVEDDEVIRESLEELLQEEGYAVRVAPEGRSALTMLRTGFRPRIVLLDLMMPVMDGWQFWDAMQMDHELATIPVVVVSAAREKAPAGVLRCLTKPIDLKYLLATIEAHCPRLQCAAAPP